MKVVILAGGFGTRISEESHLRPKPMIDIAGHPIIWHIMKIYSHYGHHDFIICGGYKQEHIKDYFANYYLYNSDVTFDMGNNEMMVHNSTAEPWKVTVADTGLDTMTGGRIKRIKDYVAGETFLLTYGDAVSDVNIDILLKHHAAAKKTITLTAVQPAGRFGALNIANDGTVQTFEEKRAENAGWINAGFMVLEPEVFDLIAGDKTVFEKEPLETAAAQGRLNAYKHAGFWQCMDTLKERNDLEDLYSSGRAPWKKW